MSALPPKRPPGRDGVPLLGETIAFAKDPFGFIDARLRAHGPIFRSRVLGRRTVVFAGPDAAGRFIDPADVVREGAMPPHIQELFGGRSLPLLDGETHAARKRLVLRAFTRDALAVYLPVMQSIVERSFAAWTGSGSLRWIDAMKRLSIEVIGANMFGLTQGEEADRLCRDYDVLTAGFATLPISFPGTPYRRAMGARDRIFAFLGERVRERRASLRDDGLSRILAASSETGTPLTDEEAVLELHHLVIAGFIVFAELGALVRQITDHPKVQERLAAEIRRRSPSARLSLEELAALPYLGQVVNEVKRLCPIIPAVFGKARRTFEFQGASVPAGWMVMWAVRPSHVGNSLYDDPERFDPDRFSASRAEDARHAHAFAPQGAGPETGHRCPGVDYATLLMQVFAVVLLEGHTWTLEGRAVIDRSKTPPEPKDGLRAVIRRR